MNPVTIDSELCKHDGLCVQECPLGVLEIKPDEKVPSIIGRKARYCINCGHCAAICPANAISISALGHRKAQPIQRKNILSSEDAALFLKTRRSIRKFKPEQLDDELLKKIINLSGYAPSGHNARPVSWTVINSRTEMEKLESLVIEWMEELLAANDPQAKKLFLKGVVRVCKEGNDIICRNAPTLAVAWAPLDGITPQNDAVVAATHLELAAHAEKIGACWAGYVNAAAQHNEKIKNFLGVDSGNMIHASILLGHPAVKYFNIPPRPQPEPEKKGNLLIFRA